MSTELQTATDEQRRQLAVADKTADESPEWRQILREAEKLAAAPLTPAHLKVQSRELAHIPEADRRRVAWQQTVANCILVANQAHRWHADVFAVASETYVVGNKLGYQGKLIAGIVNTQGGLTQPLATLYSIGKGDTLAAVIYGKRDGDVPKEAFPLLEAYADNEDRAALRKLAPMGVLAIRISVGQAKTKNAMWQNDPEQKLWYSGATKWARRHAPELMLGILSNDDLDRMRESETGAGHEEAQSRISMVIPASLDASGVFTAPPAEFNEKDGEPQATAEPPHDAPPSEPEAPDAPDLLDRAAAMAALEGRIEDATTAAALDELGVNIDGDPEILMLDRDVLRKILVARREAIAKPPARRGGGQKAFA